MKNILNIKYDKDLDIIYDSKLEYNVENFERTDKNHIYDVCFEITNMCNQMCLNCFSMSIPSSSSFLPYDFILSAIEKRKNDIVRVNISGGEPLLHPEIDKILSIPVLYPELNFILSTNGAVHLSCEQKKQIIDANWNVSISIHGNKKNHNLYTNSNNFEKTIENYIWFANNINTHIYCVLNRFTSLEDVDFLFSIANEHGCQFLRFIVPREAGRFDLKYNVILKNYILSKKSSVKFGIKYNKSNSEVVDVNGISRMSY